jgi:hypothetical protein
MTNEEQRYLDAKAAADEAKAELAEAKAALLEAHGLTCGKPCTEDEAACYEQGKIELDAVTISHYAKSQATWDNKALEDLSETVPAILEARRINYRVEARIKVKA